MKPQSIAISHLMTRKFALTTVTVQDQSLPVEGHVNPRAKKLRLRFHRNHKSLIVTLPSRASTKQAIAFVHSALPWIHKNMPDAENLIRLKPGQEIPLLGDKRLLLKHHPHPRVSIWEDETSLTLHCPEEHFEPYLTHYLKNKLRLILTGLITQHCTSLGVNYNRLYIRDSRTNWGCCSQQKNLSFSWRLIFAPHAVIDYVAAHEVAHLLEMNHSPKFWSHVEQICPAYKEHRRWLKTKGKVLM